MKTISSEQRTLQTETGDLSYTFERKGIRNINLRIRPNGCVYVSAPENAEIATVEHFLSSKTDYIRNARERFATRSVPAYEMQYISGENVTLLGRNLRIQIVKDKDEYVTSDGIYVFIHVRQPDYYNRKKNLLNAWLNEQCSNVFTEIMQQTAARFVGYGITMPKLRIRNMVSRWGSCQKGNGTIALNRRLIEAPENCIEYVVIHEFCHLVYPNHSKQFYALLQVMLPNWRESKNTLENYGIR